MPRKTYVVDLTPEERETLDQLLRRGQVAARQATRARILLKAADGWTDARIVDALGVGRATVERTRRRFVEESLGALTERPRPGQPPKLSDQQAAHLMAVACTPAPEGRVHWTLKLLADKAVALEFVESIARETVRQVLKKTASSRG